MSRLIAAALAASAVLVCFAGCGDDTTTVINTTVVEDSTDDTATTTTADEIDADDGDPDDGDDIIDADDDPDGAVVSLKAFQSPTGNIACALSAKFVRCDIAEKTWTAPRPAGCPKESDFGQGLAMSATGPAEVVCAGDTVLNPQAETLAYGASSQIGPISCESDESGIDCSNGSGGEFSLSREEYELE